MITLDNLQKKIDLSLDGLKEATNRFRTVFVLYNLAAVLIFIALFNQEYSWQKNVNYKNRPYMTYVKRVGIDSSSDAFQELRKHYAEMYFERQFFTIPLLGIKCSGSDLTVYAPIAMIIFSTWFFFTARRENHTLLEIERDFIRVKRKIDDDNSSRDEWKLLLHYIYSGCIQHFVFITPSKSDYVTVSRNTGQYDPEEPSENLDIDKKDINTNKIARPVLSLLIWIPLLILLFVFYTDVADAIVSWSIMKQHLNEIIKLDSFLLFSCVLIAYQIFYTRKITSNTANILKSMLGIIKSNVYQYHI